MKKLVIVILLFGMIHELKSQEIEHPKTFIGGMLVHSGYLQNSRSDDEIAGMCYGIGGQMSFYVGNYFRLGTEGYASNYHYPGNDGYHKLGWGGLLVGYQLGNKKLHPVFNLTIGAGKVKDLYFISGSISDNNVDNVTYRVYSDMVIAPSINLEYALKSCVSLVLKFDYVIPVFSSNYSDFAYGPRIYMGVLFNK